MSATHKKAPCARLLDQLSIQAADVPAWARESWEKFRVQVLDPKYPCYFATIAEKRGELRYTYLDDPHDGTLPETMRAFCKLSAENPKTLHALVVFVKPPLGEIALEQSGEHFWRTLQRLHDADMDPWPANIPTNPENPDWEFCFAGTPMFVFGANPAYKRRRSRNLGPGLVLLFQPRVLFSPIEGGTPAGEKARRVIRGRAFDWDGLEVHPDTGNYRDSNNREWKQYWLPDDNTPVQGTCPLKIRSAKEEPPLRISKGALLELGRSVRSLLPDQGCVEVQRDVAGKVHAPHRHTNDEVLLIVEGELTFTAGNDSYVCSSGDRIDLPANTLHSSVAGVNGATYVILAKGSA